MSGRHPQGGLSQDANSRSNRHANSQGYGQVPQPYAQPPSGYAHQYVPSIQGYDPRSQAAHTTSDGSGFGGGSRPFIPNQYPLAQPANVSAF
jgi:hypothetical protein